MTESKYTHVPYVIHERDLNSALIVAEGFRMVSHLIIAINYARLMGYEFDQKEYVGGGARFYTNGQIEQTYNAPASMHRASDAQFSNAVDRGVIQVYIPPIARPRGRR